MTELELIIDLHKNAERQGPCSEEDTLRALELIDIFKRENLKIADIGCGTGGQTKTLAQNTNAEIIAVDLFPEFLRILEQNALKAGLQDKIKTSAESMDALSFEKESLDIIWSEGSIYNMGFEKGIKNWGEFLKPGGYLSVSEITWISGSRPAEIQDFWEAEYPEIASASEKTKVLENNGFTLRGYFILPQTSWIQNYYKPMERRFDDFLRRHHHCELARRVVETHREEISLYQKYKSYYSYGFYVAKKV